MNYYVMTIFPDMIENGVNYSIIRRAALNGIINIDVLDIREFSKDKHKKVDGYPYGGGVGMVMAAQPIYDCFLSIKDKLGQNSKVIYLSPQGRVFDQNVAFELKNCTDIVLLCGHYEGVDERILEEIVTDEISIGDFVLTGGELPALVVIDAVSRLLDGVLSDSKCYEDESLSSGLLEYPQYTRPFEFLGKTVPDVLLSGHHQKISDWRQAQSIQRTKNKRPDLLN